MDTALFWSLFSILGMAYFAIGIVASRKIESEQDFFFSKRVLQTLPIALSITATQLGGGVLVGSVEEGFKFGLYGLSYNLGIVFGLLILSFGIAYKLRNLNIDTVVELFYIKYGSKRLQKFASILSIITLSGILASQIIASKILFAFVDKEQIWILLVFWLLVIIYTTFGGLKAVVATEIAQLSLLAILMYGLLFYLFSKDHTLIIKIKDAISSINFKELNDQEYKRLSSLFILPLFYIIISQDMGQRFFSAKSGMTASLSAFFASTLVFIFGLVPVVLGIFARNYGFRIDESPSILLNFLGSNVSLFFYYLIICAFIAAISASANSMLIAISSNVVKDFLFDHKDIDQHAGLLLSRVITFFIGIIVLILAYLYDDIFSTLALSYEISVSLLFVPLFMAILIKKPNKLAAKISIILGFFGMIVFRLYNFPLPKELMVLLLSFLGFILIHYYYLLKKSI